MSSTAQRVHAQFGDQRLARRFRVALHGHHRGDHVGGFESDGKLMSQALMIRGGIKRRVGLHVGNRREAKIPEALVAVILEIFHDFRRRVHRLPVDAVASGHDHAAVQIAGLPQNLLQKLRLRGIVFLVHQGGANADRDVFLFGEGVEIVKKRERRLFGHAVRVFRKRLRGDADGLHFVAGQPVAGLGVAQHRQGIGNLLLVLGGVQANERGDGADFWFFLRRCGRDNRRKQKGRQENGVRQERKDVRGAAAVAKHQVLLKLKSTRECP